MDNYKYTGETYKALQEAYDHFNNKLFNDALPQCLITLARHKGAYGYYAENRFGDTQDATASKVDEIALNPQGFNREAKAVLSTLVHEMVHLQQAHQYKSPRGGYHDKQWGTLMEAVGLVPSSTGEPGGKRTGQKVSHYIVKGNQFDKACDELLANGFIKLLADIWAKTPKVAKKATRAKFTCPVCGLNAWAAPGSKFLCHDCEEVMEEETK
jgi:predicted SprT family Zn-dependent metalloprotease